jgi:serine/threonine-protein kinase
MEFVDGETVEQIVDRDGPMPLDRALDIAIQVLRAITYIWRFKIVHRDIKPGNIMLTRSGTAKLADFGFVKSKFDPLLSTEGEVLGTPDYISPEQALGLTDIDFRSDIYSLGCSLYHMLTGQTPFGGTSSEVMRKHIKEEPPPLHEAAPDLPEAACELLEKMMSKDPEERYENTQQLFEDIELIRMGQVRGAEGPTAGKATILRAFNIEKGRLERMQADIKLFRERLRRTRMIMYSAIAISAVLSVALLIALAKL